MKQVKLELTWIGKENRPKLEPRILVEDPAKSYHAPFRTGKNDFFDNRLIFGDNLLALKALEQEFVGKIKCIYIDPPYNTGTAFEHYDDGIEHSIWLSLIRDRLELLHRLLINNGSLWISIDDTECHYLKVLCDELFGRSNFIACLPTVMNLKGNQDQFGFAGTHEYTLVYAKDRAKCHFNDFSIGADDLESWDSDDKGPYKKGAPMRATGEEAKRENRPYMFYPILVKEQNIAAITHEEFSLLYNKESKQFNDK
ncbi:MAG: site-specific DNA-methyltransferase, partial [Planctomycetota bacterium]